MVTRDEQRDRCDQAKNDSEDGETFEACCVHASPYAMEPGHYAVNARKIGTYTTGVASPFYEAREPTPRGVVRSDGAARPGDA